MKRIACVAGSFLMYGMMFAQGRVMTLEGLYGERSVIGTKVEEPVWALDSKGVAFLWNEDGTEFRDVWVAGVGDARPRRVTRLKRLELPRDAGTDVAKLEEVEKAENQRGAHGVRWTGDGKRLVFSGQGTAWSVAVEGGEPVRLGGEGVGVLEPAPAGERVALAGADGVLRVGSADGRGGLVTVYDPARKDVGVESVVWSHDGRRLAFVETDTAGVPRRGIPDYLGAETRLEMVMRPFPGEPSERRRVGVVNAEGGPVTWVELDGGPMDLLFGVNWSPDDRSLLIDRSDLYVKDRRLLVADAATGKTRVLLRDADAKNVTAEWWSAWAEDGRGVYFTSDNFDAERVKTTAKDADYAVWYEPLTGGAPRPVVEGRFAVFGAALAGGRLFAETNAGERVGRSTLVADLKSGAVRPLGLTGAGGKGTHEAVPSPDGRWLADVWSDDGTPPELYLEAVDGDGAMRRVTQSPGAEFGAYRWQRAQYVEMPGSRAGTMLEGRLTLPAGFDRTKRYPMIVGSVYSNSARDQWGGRVFHPTWGLDQLLAQKGYVLLNVNMSGSSGYGRAFRQAIREDYGGVDVDDLAAAVRWMEAQGYVDPKRVGIWGSSYGGLLTTMSLFRYPGLYAAGVAGAPATSLFHALTGEMRVMMMPEGHEAPYARASSFLHSGGLEGHLMLLHGMRDEVVLFGDSVKLEERLILEGKDVTLTVLPKAPHGWDTEGLAQTRYAYGRLVEFFGRWLE